MTIEGLDKLIGVFGYVPSFHDAETVQVLLDRVGPTATITLSVPRYENKQFVGDYLVVIRFGGVGKFQLEGFNHQNVVSSLTWEEVEEEGEWTSGKVRYLRVSLDTVFGAWAEFVCSSIEVLSVSADTTETGRRL